MRHAGKTVFLWASAGRAGGPLFCSKLYLRVLRPNWPALADSADPVPRPLRRAFEELEAQLKKICDDAHLRPAC